eukprot:CAMPEP_0182552466 /NCGR_PEP_ID=MMETSP1323-20130603/48430_1 /TAXON_ID=236787 /ORGANISM="Florenciella parvula, Strain RCC1693" /LENGTH=34 /DNA_ID= /DNA_START= /DNA_END= /DNA_ORIENTATION=
MMSMTTNTQKHGLSRTSPTILFTPLGSADRLRDE